MGNFDQYADSYQGVHGDNVRVTGETSKYFARYKASYVARRMGAQFSGRILDYGCGVGMVSSFLMQALPNAAVDGFDLSAASIANVDSALRVQGTFTSDWNDVGHGYNLVLVSNVMHHVPPNERFDVMATIRDRLAPGGVLIIVEHNPLNPLTRWAVANCAFDDDAILIPTAEAKAFVSRSGLEIVRRDYIVFFPHLLSWLRGLEPYLSWCPAGAQYALMTRRGADV
jgi:2-polyprenyl-3-methyl-5-hydroxy-6-metoxy-1,4-benzoquinol methylase